MAMSVTELPLSRKSVYFMPIMKFDINNSLLSPRPNSSRIRESTLEITRTRLFCWTLPKAGWRNLGT